MMRELETKDAGRYAYAAAMDAQRRNSNNKSRYSAEQIRKALSARDLLDSAFAYTRLYINYRERFIAVKADMARSKGKLSKEVLELFKSNGYDVVATPQALIVRIAK
jgi:hypothetical protein